VHLLSRGVQKRQGVDTYCYATIDVSYKKIRSPWWHQITTCTIKLATNKYYYMPSSTATAMNISQIQWLTRTTDTNTSQSLTKHSYIILTWVHHPSAILTPWMHASCSWYILELGKPASSSTLVRTAPPQPTCHLDRLLPSRSLPRGQRIQYWYSWMNQLANKNNFIWTWH
jgi:hypothetical protein